MGAGGQREATVMNLVPLAMWILKRNLKKHPDFAWSWHCNLAMLAQEAGAPWEDSNIRAANFMVHCFGVDTFDQFKQLKKPPL